MPSQFGEPRGGRGWLAAHVVARLTGEANRWMVDCLAVGPQDRMLDVGCGPGLAVAYAAGLGGAWVAGVDPSDIMVRHAVRRNRRAIQDGRVEIHRADASALPFPDGFFSAVGSLNSLQFWPDPGAGVAELYRVVELGGRVAVALMARGDDAPGPECPAWMDRTAAVMEEAGFGELEIAARPFGGVLHRALVGRRPGKKIGAPLNPTADGVRKGAGL